MPVSPATLTVLYDAECGICARCRLWLEKQPQLVPLRFESYQAALTSGRYQGLAQLHPDREICVISQKGEVWRGDAAWILCLYALHYYRPWAFRLATPALRPLAKSVCAAVSANRLKLSRWLALSPISSLQSQLQSTEPMCETDRCAR